MNLNNCYNLKVTEYANKNILQHKQSKSIDLPMIYNNNVNSLPSKNSEHSRSEKSIMFKVHPDKQVIMTDLTTLFDRYDTSTNVSNKEPSMLEEERKLRKKEPETLVYSDKFYKEFKVS